MVEFSALDSEITTKLSLDTKNQSYSRKKQAGKVSGFAAGNRKKLATPLRGAQITGFTPNTGGIELPFLTFETHDNRALIDRASVGVTFTPVDIRIRLNFGSQAHKYRIRYYEMLLNGELMNEFESLNRKDTGYCLCDTFWHYHNRNLQSLQWCLTLYGSTKINIENAIEETKQLEGTPLTANKYLIRHSWVRSGSSTFSGCNDYDA